MANYYGNIITSLFRVTDEAAFNAIMERTPNNVMSIKLEDQQVGETFYGIRRALPGYAIQTLIMHMQEKQLDLNAFAKELQTVIPQGEAAMLYTEGCSDMPVSASICTVITSDSIKTLDIRDEALRIARELLDDEEYTAPVIINPRISACPMTPEKRQQFLEGLQQLDPPAYENYRQMESIYMQTNNEEETE